MLTMAIHVQPVQVRIVQISISIIRIIRWIKFKMNQRLGLVLCSASPHRYPKPAWDWIPPETALIFLLTLHLWSYCPCRWFPNHWHFHVRAPQFAISPPFAVATSEPLSNLTTVATRTSVSLSPHTCNKDEIQVSWLKATNNRKTENHFLFQLLENSRSTSS